MRTIVIISILAGSSGLFGRTLGDSSSAEMSTTLSSLLLDDLLNPEAADYFSETIGDLLIRPYDLSAPDDRILQLIPTLTELEMMKLRLMKNARTEGELRQILSNKLYDRSRAFLALTPQPKYSIELRSRTGVDPTDVNEEEYVEGKYSGSSIKSSNLVRLYSEHITAGFVQSKDAGEPLFLDHVGGYGSLAHPLAFSERLSLRNAVIGDYSVGYGEGLILRRGYARTKSVDAISPLGIGATGIGNYLSTSAYRFYRGAAASLQFDRATLDLFYSNRFVDATTSDTGTVTSLAYTGYHRSGSEQNRRLSTKQIVSGANLAYQLVDDNDAKLFFSATGYRLSFDRTVIPSDSLRTRFAGKNLTAGSLSAAAFFGNYSLRAEVAESNSDAAKGYALTTTLLARPWERWEFAANVRILPEEFLSPLGGTFGDNASDVQNETGGYVGVRTFANEDITVEGYFDISSRMEPTQTAEHDLLTRDARLAASWSRVGSPFQVTLESRYRSREELTAVRSDTVEPHDKLNIRVKPDYRFSDVLHMALHTEFVRYQEPGLEGANGYLAGAIVYYQPFAAFNLALSTFVYSTDSYDARIYITEPEVPAVGGFNFLYGDGFRYSILLSAKPFEGIQLFGKFSESSFWSPSSQTRERRPYITFQAELRL